MKNYLCIISIFLILGIVNCQRALLAINKASEECEREIGLTDSMKSSSDPDDPVAKCFHTCMMKKFGSIVNSKVVAGKAIQVEFELSPRPLPDIIKEFMIECAAVANEEKEECEVGGTFKKCMVEKRENLKD